jgi:REP element-mobilizing transposase RayT
MSCKTRNGQGTRGIEVSPGRKSQRLQNYDYAQPGAYFVTICVHRRQYRLGNVSAGHFAPSVEGEIADRFWIHTQVHFNRISIDAYVIMPNHVHAIIVIEGSSNRRGGVTPPLQNRDSLGDVVAYYKYQTTKAINLLAGTSGTRFWQRNYYDHVIRDETDLARYRQYILDNPLRWELDRYFMRS